MKDIKETIANALTHFSQFKPENGSEAAIAYQRLKALHTRLESQNLSPSEVVLSLARINERKAEILSLRRTAEKYLRENKVNSLLRDSRKEMIATLNDDLGVINAQIANLEFLKKNSVDQLLINKIIQEVGLEKIRELQQQAMYEYKTLA